VINYTREWLLDAQHVGRIRNIWEWAGKRTEVIADELGPGSGPRSVTAKIVAEKEEPHIKRVRLWDGKSCYI
jgi:hypothetical protein